jgi:hypothetical protein
MTTKRCTAAERRAFEPLYLGDSYGEQIGEPALGTLDQRLHIILRRLGARVAPVRMTARERNDYERWLQSEVPAS